MTIAEKIEKAGFKPATAKKPAAPATESAFTAELRALARNIYTATPPATAGNENSLLREANERLHAAQAAVPTAENTFKTALAAVKEAEGILFPAIRIAERAGNVGGAATLRQKLGEVRRAMRAADAQRRKAGDEVVGARKALIAISGKPEVLVAQAAKASGYRELRALEERLQLSFFADPRGRQRVRAAIEAAWKRRSDRKEGAAKAASSNLSPAELAARREKSRAASQRHMANKAARAQLNRELAKGGKEGGKKK